jgi:DNA-3-methyladenine glycosylase
MLGATLVRDDGTGRRAGTIVEVEGYIGTDDRASHARFGPTDRNRVMFGPPGVAYVYLVYGMYDCLNVVTEPSGRAAAVLIRAVEPLAGTDEMRESRARLVLARRKAPFDAVAAARERQRLARLPDDRLAAGPGLVCAAFGIERRDTGIDLCDPSSPIRLERGRAVPPAEIRATPRIGVAYAGEPWTSLPWRVAVVGSPALSAPA